MNEHSEKFNMVKHFYKLKVWKLDRVRNAVVMNGITEEEYKEITGQDY